MKLFLVQHGLAVSKEVDPGRPLDPKGEEDVRRMAEYLGQTGVTVNRILHSGKMRAHQTADIFGEALLISGETEAISGLKPNDPVRDFARIVDKFEHDTMVVGHLPFMARMVAYLVADNEDLEIVAYQPGSIVCLERNADDHWQIQWMLRPDTL